MIKPKGLKLGDTIGIVAPGSPTTEEKVEKAYKKLKEIGFKVKLGKSCYSKHGYLAGRDELRADDLNSMFRSTEVDGIICLRGGYGSIRILDLLDYNLIRTNPKVFVGYSDITALHIAINQISNLVTFHGPMAASDLAGDISRYSLDSLFNSILSEEFDGKIINPTEELIAINGGVVEGQIIGGNLSLITSTIGTPYEIDTKGKILFIEEIGEEPYRIDRMLNQLKLSNKLQEAEGIILGNFSNCMPEDPDMSLTLEEVIDDLIRPLNKPTLYNLQAGHCDPNITIPFGVRVRLNADRKEIVVLEKPTLEVY
jgi:muramoyltetrapeptide carboxypeptidase